MEISIHALREEGDTKSRDSGNTILQFLSTPSARRATSHQSSCCWCSSYFYPRPPRGGRPVCAVRAVIVDKISIHALREEGDGRSCVGLGSPCNFYPRPPRGGRPTSSISLMAASIFLSTPSARRATYNERLQKHDFSYFYPRPPRGGRQPATLALPSLLVFLSTPSARRATPWQSIHGRSTQFLSTPSARRATQCRPAYP